MINLRNDLTILIVSTDSYSDLWDNFFLLKEKFWSDCPCETILATNNTLYNRKGVKVLNCGNDAQWSKRTIKALNAISTKYVCFLLEDFYMSKKILNSNLEAALSIMENAGLPYYKLTTLSPFNTNYFNSNSHLKIIPASYPYGISLMAAIWDTNYFIDMIGDANYNPWKFEIDRLNEEKESPNPDKIVGVFDSRNILNITHMVVQGKYLPPAIKIMNKLGISPNIETRPIMSKKEYLIYLSKQKISILQRDHPILGYLFSPLKKFSVTEKYK